LVYVDVNVLYYFFTAHPQFGEGSRELLKRHQGSPISGVGHAFHYIWVGASYCTFEQHDIARENPL